MLTALLRNWQLVLYVVVGAVLVYGGFYVKGKFARAADATRIEAENGRMKDAARDLQHRLERAEAGRIEVSRELDAERRKVKVQVQTVVKTVKVHVKDNRECDIPVEVLKALNQARGYQE